MSTRMLPVILAGALGIFQYQLWFGPSGVLETIHLSSEVTRQKAIYAEGAERDRKLKDEIQALKHDPALAESLARQNLNMTKRGESYYRFVPNEPAE